MANIIKKPYVKLEWEHKLRLSSDLRDLTALRNELKTELEKPLFAR